MRPGVEHGDALHDSLLALRGPRDVDIDVLDAAGHSPVGCVARASGEDLVQAVVEEPDLGMVVRLRSRYRNSKHKPVLRDHPCEAVESVLGERRCIDASLDEHVDDQLSCFVARHPCSPLDGGAFVREQRRRDREVDRICPLAVEVHREARSKPFNPPDSEPAECATHRCGGTKPRYQGLAGNRVLRQLEEPWFQGRFVPQHA